MSNRPKKIRAGVYSYLGYTLYKGPTGGSLADIWVADLDPKLAEIYSGEQLGYGFEMRRQERKQNEIPVGLYRQIRDFTLGQLAEAIRKQNVLTYNCLNRAAGTFPIAWERKGTCCDPATETYHCM